jgi:signal peptidase I
MTDDRPRFRTRVRRWLREARWLIAIAVLLLTVRSSLANHYKVPTGSMEPTVEVGDRIVVNKAAYGLRLPFASTYAITGGDPELGEVVVLDSPEEDKVLLKRIAGTPGKRVEVRGGRITIDGALAPITDGQEQLGEALHPIRITGDGGPDFGPLVIPDGHYLVMGDNRGESNDGRSFGLVTRDAILGRALGVYWRGGPTWEGL